MPRVAVPVNRIEYDADFEFTNEIVNVFEANRAWNPNDALSFTGRVTIDLSTDEGRRRRDEVVEALHAHCTEAQHERLVQALDESGWDLSFFVDCW